MTKLNLLNKINWTIALTLFLSLIPVISFNQIIFIPDNEIIRPAKIISILFVINIIFVSLFLRFSREHQALVKYKIRKHKMFKMKLNGKNIFTNNAPRLFSNAFQSYKVTFFIIPFLAMFSGLALSLTLITIIPGIYTKFEGKPETWETIVLDKKTSGKRDENYSIKLEEFEEYIYVKYIDFINMEVDKKIMVSGKTSEYGHLLQKFSIR